MRWFSCRFLTAVHLLTVLTVAAAWAPAVRADDWPQFRGPGSLGLPAQESPSLPDTWTPTENVLWRTDVAGVGWSSPIVARGRVILTATINDDEIEPPKKGLYFGGNRPEPPKGTHHWVTYGLDLATGKILWKKEAYAGPAAYARHLKNSYASETPATDGQRVFVYFGNLGLFCYDLDGNELWAHRWEPRGTRYGWGTAASPVVHEGRVYTVNDNEDESYLAAYDARTGEPAWKVERDEKSNWATPYIWRNEVRTEIVTPGTMKTRSYDLNGRLLWQFTGMSSITIMTPFSRHGLLYVSSGYVGDKLRPVYAIRPGANGDISLKEGERSNTYIAWSDPEAAPYNPSPLIYGDYYYTLLDRGFFTCHDARTGAEIYGKRRIDPQAAAFTASPWAYHGKLFCLSEDGDAFVIKAGPDYELLGVNRLGEMCMATPAIVDGSVLLRTASRLYRLQEGARLPVQF